MYGDSGHDDEGIGMTHSDATLVCRTRDGDKDAYGELYDRYARLVRAICYDATGDLADAQDLAQESFLRAYRRLNTLREPERFVKWLTGVCRMVCREWRRGKAHDRHRYAGAAAERAETREPAADCRADALREAIRRLPEKERLALHAFYLQDQSAKQARTVLGLSRSGFYRVMSRARKRLAQQLNNGMGDM